MKTLAVIGTLALGVLLSGPAHAGDISSVLPGSGVQLGLPGLAGLPTALGLELPRALIGSIAAGAIQLQPAKPPPKDLSLTINVNEEKEGVTRAWYLSPVWMAIGGLGLLLAIVLVIMAARGGGGATTVVRG